MKQLLAPPSIAKVKHATRSRRQLRGQVAMAQLAHDAERDRKRHLMPVATTPSTRPEAMTPVDETVRYVLADREHVDDVNTHQAIAHADAELRSARQITEIAAEAAALLLGPVPE
jgi:hypothetical protein